MLLDADPLDQVPFVDLPRKDGALARFTAPLHVAAIEFGEVTPDCRLRAPSYITQVDDADPTACLLDDVLDDHERAVMR